MRLGKADAGRIPAGQKAGADWVAQDVVGFPPLQSGQEDARLRASIGTYVAFGDDGTSPTHGSPPDLRAKCYL
jgi:hypothetical protein